MTKKRLVEIFVLVTTAFFLALTLYLGFELNNFYKKIHVKKQDNHIVSKDKTIYNILLLGYGGPRHDGAYLTDTIILAHIDTKKKKVVLISIPRDLWVDVPTYSGKPFYTKINSLFEMGIMKKKNPDIKVESGIEGGVELLEKDIYKITGLKVDNFVAIDFSGFEEFIDMLGGVKIYVKKSFDDYEYPRFGHEDDLCGKSEDELPELEKIATKSLVLAFPCRYEHLHFDKGWQVMNGERALKYVRSRHALQDGGDFARSRRQQEVIEAIENKLISFNVISRLGSLLQRLAPHVKTDLELDQIKNFALKLKNGRGYSVTTFVLSPPLLKEGYSSYGAYILVPQKGIDKWRDIKKAIFLKISSTSAILNPTLNSEEGIKRE